MQLDAGSALPDVRWREDLLRRADLDMAGAPLMPRRIRLSRAKGWKLPPGAVSVARGPGRRWGNPFVIGKVGPLGRGPVDRVGATVFFACMFSDEELRRAAAYPTIREIQQELRGRDLACWCPLDQPCHVDILLPIANSEDRDAQEAPRP